MQGVSTLSAFPSAHVAGDTLVVERSAYDDAPIGDGYTVVATLLDTAGKKITATAVESTVYTFTVAASAWAGIAPGPVSFAVTATKSGARTVVESGTILVSPDPTVAASGPTSKLAHVERVIAACEAKLEGKITEDVQMYQLPDGVTVSRMTLREVRETLAAYKAKRVRMLRGGKPRVRETWYALRG